MKKNSYAKLNLVLNVTNKTKPTNLHDLDMINVIISLKDTIKIIFLKDQNEQIIIESNNSKIPLDHTNLVSKVINKFKKQFNLSFSCKVIIKKNIPLEAGLGGGSSNAATTLNILDKHFKTKMTIKQKMLFLESLTSDGPYMIVSRTSRIKGNGNQISLIDNHIKFKRILLVKPKTGCSTKDVYSALDYKNLIHPNVNKIEEALLNNNYLLLAKHINNSLTSSAATLNKDIIDTLNRLKSCGFEIVSMSGAGSTCFAISKNKRPYKLAKSILKKEDYELFQIVKIK